VVGIALCAMMSLGITAAATGQSPSASTTQPGASAAASAAPVPAVRIGAVGKSLCAALTEKEIRKAIGYKVKASNQVDHCEWFASEYGDPEVGVYLGWSDTGIDELKALAASDASTTLTDLTVGDRPALLRKGPSQPDLTIELEQGPITISASDPYGGDYSEALPKLGELVVKRADSLVALPPGDPVLLGLFPTTVGDLEFASHVVYPEKVFTKDSGRDNLRKALKKADKAITDVSLASGIAYAANDSVIVNALRVAGADASSFTKLGINAAGLWGAFPPVPDPVPNGSIGVVQTPSGDQMYVYPKDDIVWVLVGDDALVDQALAALPGAPDRSAIPTPTPAPTPDVSTPEGRIRSILPASLGGEALHSLYVLVGKEAESLMTSDGAKALRRIAKAQGATIRDIWIIQGSYPQPVAFQAIRIDGGDATPIAELSVDNMRAAGVLGKGEDPTPAVVGGKQVGTVPYGAATAYLYTGGDTVWVVTTDDPAVAAELLAALP
jgi:hypothetical protein